jgi:hypothetical protein
LGDIHIDKWTCGLAISTLQFSWMENVQRSGFSAQEKEKEKKITYRQTSLTNLEKVKGKLFTMEHTQKKRAPLH